MTVGLVVPTLIADAGKQVAQRFLGFFAATIRHTNTRMAYYRAVLQFFSWCDQHQLGQLVDIEPLHVAAYIEALQKDFAKPSVKQHLAAIRMLFDWLVHYSFPKTAEPHAEDKMLQDRAGAILREYKMRRDKYIGTARAGAVALIRGLV